MTTLDAGRPAPGFDENAYRKSVLAPMLAAGAVRMDDPFALLGLDPDDPRLEDAAALRTRLAEVVGFWQRERSSPRYKSLAGELVRQRASLERLVLDPAARRGARTRVQVGARAQVGARLARVDRLVGAVVARHGGVPRSRLPLLRELATAAGVGAADLDALLAGQRLLDDGGDVEPPPPAVRRQVRTALDELALRGEPGRSGSLWAYLGVPSTAPVELLTSRFEELSAQNLRRPHERDKTVHAELLAHVRGLLLDDARRPSWLAALLEDAGERIRLRLLELALVDAELWPADVDALVAALLEAGLALTPEQARTVVRRTATALGVSVTTAAPVAAAPLPPPRAPMPAVAAGFAPPPSGGLLAPPISAPLPHPSSAPAAPGGTAPAPAEEQWRQLERDVSLRRLVAATTRAAALAHAHPDVPGPGGLLPAARYADLQLRLGAARERVVAARLLAHPAEREDALHAVLGTAADLDDAAAALAELPLAVPQGVEVQVAGGAAHVRWAAPQGGRRLTWSVTRVGRDAAGARLEVPLGATTRCEVVDRDLPAGAVLSWEVVARSGGRRSAPAATPPRPMAVDVVAVRAATGPDGVTLSWEMADGELRHEVVVERSTLAPAEGPLRRHRLRGTRWVDGDARDGVAYSYRLFVEVTADGRVHPTPGCRVDVAVGAPAAPVADLRVVEGSPRTLGWTAPGECWLLASPLPLGEAGAPVALGSLSQRARLVGSTRGGGPLVDALEPPDVTYTVVALISGGGVLGEPLVLSAVTPVHDAHLQEAGGQLLLHAVPPPGCAEVLVLWRRDRPLIGPDDAAGGQAVPVEALGRWAVPVPADGLPVHLLLCAVHRRAGEPVLAAGLPVAARVPTSRG